MPACSSPLRREDVERWGACASLESACPLVGAPGRPHYPLPRSLLLHALDRELGRQISRATVASQHPDDDGREPAHYCRCVSDQHGRDDRRPHRRDHGSAVRVAYVLAVVERLPKPGRSRGWRGADQLDGAIAGFVSPYFVGWVKDATQSTDMALYLLAGVMLLGAILVSNPRVEGRR